MDEPRGQAQRGAQKSTKMVSKLADRGAQTTAALTEANQHVLNEFMGLSMETWQETARLFTRMQQSALEALREGQAAALRAQMAWPEMFKDPMRWYQSVCQESMDGARKAFDAINGTSEAVTESVNRLQSSAEQAGTSIERALTSCASRMKDAA
jgi:hypothetical protein